MYERIGRLDRIVGRLNTHPEYSTELKSSLYKSMLESANEHSVRIEKDLFTDGLDSYHTTASHAMQNINAASEFLCSSEGLTLTNLTQLGKLVQPDNKAPVRINEVHFGPNAGVQPEKIYYDLENLVYRLEHFPGHSFDRAVEAHIEMVRIHPYSDGNGRASRLLQNYCLNQRGYPAATLFESDRDVLIALLNQTLAERNIQQRSFENMGLGEKGLRSYILDAAIKSAEDIENHLIMRREYNITVNAPSKHAQGIAKKFADAIRSEARRKAASSAGVSVHKTHLCKNEFDLYVIGDLSTEEIRETLERASSKLCKKSQALKFEIVKKQNLKRH